MTLEDSIKTRLGAMVFTLAQAEVTITELRDQIATLTRERDALHALLQPPKPTLVPSPVSTTTEAVG